MLTGNGFDFSAAHSHGCQIYEEATIIIPVRYNNADKKARVLMEWRKISLAEEMRKIPSDAEFQVFNRFFASLKGLQKQLDKDYHHYRCLRDRFLTLIDVQVLQEPLGDRMPRTAQ